MSCKKNDTSAAGHAKLASARYLRNQLVCWRKQVGNLVMGLTMSSEVEPSIAVQALTLSRWPAKSNFNLSVFLQYEQFE